MKIVIDARESGTTTGRYVDKLIEYLQIVDRVNNYVVLYKKDRIEQIKLSSDNFHKVVANYKEFSFGEQLGFARLLYKQKADLVHFPAAQQPIFYLKPRITTVLDLTTLRFRNPSKIRLLFWIRQKIYWLVILLSLFGSRRILTISNFVVDDIKKTFKFSVNKFTTTYLASDAIKESPEVVEEIVGKEFLMYVGRHMPHKNLPRLIQAHQELLKKYPQLVLAIAGKKDSATDNMMSSFAEKPKNVIFTGFVSDGQLRWMYENTSCYVFPSLSEGFGLPGLEAMKHGAPVASSNTTCLPEIYGDAAVYFSPYSVLEMAEVINDVLTHKKLRQDLIVKGKKQSSKYSWQHTATLTRDAYNTFGK